MSNQVTKFANAGLPSVQSLCSALRQIDTGTSGGNVILKMDKTGHWVFGADQTEAEDDSVWAVNPFSFVHGFIAWGDGSVAGEKMAPVTDPLPDTGPAPAGSDCGWEMQVGFSLACTNGEDEGMQARFSTTSVGGKRAVQTLAVAIADQAEKHPDKPVALVSLRKEHYQHKKYGRIYSPIFDIVGWATMDAAGEEPVEADEPEETVAEEQPRRRRRAAA